MKGVTLAAVFAVIVAPSTQLLLAAWDKGLEDKAKPFDENIEQKRVRQWLLYANSVGYAAAMGGPDHAAFKNDWWSLTEPLSEMHDLVRPKTEAKG